MEKFRKSMRTILLSLAFLRAPSKSCKVFFNKSGFPYIKILLGKRLIDKEVSGWIAWLRKP